MAYCGILSWFYSGATGENYLSVLSICNQDLDPGLVRYKEEMSNCVRR